MSEYHKILDVEANATEDEIKKAYRRMSMKYHPDRNPDDKDAENKFKEAKEAYEILSGKKKPEQQYQHRSQHTQWKDVDEFFRRANTQYHYHYSRPTPHALNTAISLKDAYHGVSRKLNTKVQHPCTACHGQGFDTSGPTVTVCGVCNGNTTTSITLTEEINIPAGANDGDRFQFTDSATGVSFVVSVHILPNDQFERHGNNLRTLVEIPFYTAMLGGSVKVETIDGAVNIKIPAGIHTVSGSSIRMKGKGMPITGSLVKGDLYGTVLISVPKEPSDEQKELIQKFAELETTDEQEDKKTDKKVQV